MNEQLGKRFQGVSANSFSQRDPLAMEAEKLVRKASLPLKLSPIVPIAWSLTSVAVFYYYNEGLCPFIWASFRGAVISMHLSILISNKQMNNKASLY